MAKKTTTETAPETNAPAEGVVAPIIVQEGDSIQAEGVEGDLPVGTIITEVAADAVATAPEANAPAPEVATEATAPAAPAVSEPLPPFAQTQGEYRIPEDQLPPVTPNPNALVAATMEQGKVYVNGEGVKIRVYHDPQLGSRICKDVPNFGMMEACADDLIGLTEVV